MERTGQSALAVASTDDLRDLVTSAGTVVTVSIARPDEPTPTAIGSAVSGVRDAVKDLLGTDAAALAAAEVERAFPSARGMVVVLDRDTVLLAEPLDTKPVASFIRCGSLPSLVPVIAHRQTQVPFLVVSVDRRGADMYWSTLDGDGAESVGGTDLHIRKVRGGGWSHRRIQQRAENNWEGLAGEVASALTERANMVGPRVLAIAGDLRMIDLVRERVPQELAAMIREVTGSRSEDGSEDQRADELRRWLRTAIAEDTVEALQVFDRERGQRGRAADGVADTCAALHEARVDVLLVHDDGDEHDDDDAPVAYFVGDDPTALSADRATLSGDADEDVASARAVDVVVRSALLTGAGIRIVPTIDRIRDGVGAILRW